MRRFLALFCLVLAPTALAFDWPWEEPPATRPDYCRGFVAAGLGALPVEDLSRTRLWLAWNVLTREGVPAQATAGFQQGRQEFGELLALGDNRAIVDVADGECALGRN
jgi:hypothetical protein